MSGTTDPKVEYGLCEVHYAISTYNAETKKYTYTKPVPIHGGIKITLNPTGSANTLYADNGAYYTTKTNVGYDGNLDIALVPEQFLIDVMQQIKKNGILFENKDAKTVEIALMFQFENDVSAKRHIFYRCSVDRPTVESSTQEESTTPNTSSLTIKAMPRLNDGIVKGSVLKTEETEAVYESWFDTVHQPDDEAVSLAKTYTLTTAEPDDWATNYNDYYTKNGDEYTKLNEASAPAWAADTYYSVKTT